MGIELTELVDGRNRPQAPVEGPMRFPVRGRLDSQRIVERSGA
jgi:hypothetical protein